MRNSPNALMLFAAGRGTRMAHLTQDRPKPMVMVAGRPLIDHALDLGAECNPIVVNTHYKPDPLIRHIQGRNLKISHEEALLETGGGLKHALALFPPGAVITLNTDAVWKGPNVLDMLRRDWDPRKMDALLALVPKDRALGHKGGGDFLMDDDGRLMRGAGHVYTGAQIINPKGLSNINEAAFSMNVLWDLLLQGRRVFGSVYSGEWCDVGQPESVKLAEDMLSV